MFKIEVGKKLEAEIPGGLSIIFGETGFTAIFKLSNLSDKEIVEFRKGNLRIDVSFLDKIIFFVFTNTMGIGDADIPFTIHLSKCKEFQELGENEGYAMDLMLVEANNNIAKGFRRVGLNTNTSKYLKKCVMEQLKYNFNMDEHMRKVKEIQRKYNSREIRKLAGAYSKFERKQ
ncbi:hypothetical protein IR152_10850 [Clostridioides sp. ES-S-0108-01]|uniref:hypothetical protein n=1 Tax=Clostridioides sp. ES-S-0108-01 TaxID=2770773 RepID=UPI001D0C5343|nr:hypothetical protein [Clostridioides sp. ES-S-0108-01]